jgi:N-acetylglucosaminyldiphosphoundecaprenol N-acetyl-beta-D-mannosaminyltransferase
MNGHSASSDFAAYPLDILGVKVHNVNVEGLHQFMQRMISQSEKAIIPYLNIHVFNFTFEQPWLRDFINAAPLTICDGDGLRWGIRLLGLEPPPKITYDRWIWQLAEFAERHDYSIYLLGGKPGVAKDAAVRLKGRYQRLRIAGNQDGYFQKTGLENEKIIHEINRQKPDILLVGFGVPLQEKWLLENWKKIDARVFLPSGAALAYAAGSVKSAPSWMLRFQLEWLYRFVQEPKRLFHRTVFGIPYFFYRMIKFKLISGIKKG